MLMGIMAVRNLKSNGDIFKNAKVYKYPGGIMDIICSSSPDFHESGWEIADKWETKKTAQKGGRKCADPHGEDLERSMRRARAKLRRLALANEFRWFVTLTIDPARVDSHDGDAVVKKLNAWASNMVQRNGLKYILVPERHKKGGIHFHGFFNDSVKVVDSGHMDRQGHKIFNLPQWALGFTTAIELYDDYAKAVGYVCKYVGKQGEKPAGRWYYSGGGLNEPEVQYADLDYRDFVENSVDKVFTIPLPGREIAVVNGVKCTE